MNAVNTTTTSSTLGTKIGAAIGKGAAYAAHGAIRAGQGTGRFGQDVLAGVTTGYASKAEELAAHRAQLLAQRQAPIAISVKRRATAKA